MFDIGWGELLLIGIVALIVIGPKELPGALRSLGQWMTKIRRMASEFQNQFQEAMREAELADLKKEVDEMAGQASKMTQFDPLDDVRKDVETAQREIETAVTSTPMPDEPPTNEAPVSLTSSYGDADAPPAGEHPVSADGATPSAEPPPISAASNAGAATAAAVPAFQAGEPAAPAASTGMTEISTVKSDPDAGRTPA
jgi:sec-independent protein translocase protein TatB